LEAGSDNPSVVGIRGRLLWYVSDPEADDVAARRYVEDGLLVIENGRVREAGEASLLLPLVPEGTPVADHRPYLVTPGFVDAHVHYPQTQVVASYGTQLLDWLERYTFPEEARFADPAHAAAGAAFFLDELLRNGTTTAAVFCTVHPASVDAFFAESERRGTRMIAGKVMMDQGAPAGLTDTAETGFRDSEALLARWHGRGRQLYAITPRFAVTSSPAQLEAAGRLAAAHPECHVQTHISENLREIEAALAAHLGLPDYTAIYERYGLLGPRSLMGHCLHLSDSELDRFHRAGAAAVFCPTSNLFLGSGLFDWTRMGDVARPVRIAVGTDIGGGTSYSMLATMGEAYKVLQLQGQSLSPDAAFHAMTRGNAAALGLDGVVGSFEPGREADIVVLDAAATPATARRFERVRTLEDELFLLTTMGDDRAVVATYVMGREAHRR
jgi:guanine deaminase